MSNKAHDRKDRREILLLVVIRVMFPSLITSQFMHTDHKLYSLLPDGGAADWASSAAPGGAGAVSIGVCDRQNAGFCCQVYLEVWWPSAGGQSWMNYWMTCPNSPRWMTDPLCPCNPNPQSCPAETRSHAGNRLGKLHWNYKISPSDFLRFMTYVMWYDFIKNFNNRKMR